MAWIQGCLGLCDVKASRTLAESDTIRRGLLVGRFVAWKIAAASAEKTEQMFLSLYDSVNSSLKIPIPTPLSHLEPSVYLITKLLNLVLILCTKADLILS